AIKICFPSAEAPIAGTCSNFLSSNLGSLLVINKVTESEVSEPESVVLFELQDENSIPKHVTSNSV
ncbi:MAG: hypothetical protein ACOYKR_12660, partial [Sphingobacterium thalpophilum]